MFDINDMAKAAFETVLVGCFELLGYAFLFGKLIYQPKKEGLCFFLYIGKVGIELAGSEQVVIQDFAVMLQVV